MFGLLVCGAVTTGFGVARRIATVLPFGSLLLLLCRRQKKKEIKADLHLVKDQYSHFKQQLRLCSNAKNEAGEKIMSTETAAAYNQYKKPFGAQVLSLETKLKNAQQTDRAELFAGGAEPAAEKPKEEMSATELWQVHFKFHPSFNPISTPV